MSPLVAELNYYLSLGTILLQVGTACAFLDLYFFRGAYIIRLIERFASHLLFGAAFFGTVLTLVYSEYFGFVPCGLCWFERIFLYPLVVIYAVALWYREEKSAARFSLALSTLGGVIALYHHYIQMGGAEFVKCPAAGAECAKRIIFEFNYVTFPLMAFTLFAFLALLSLVVLRRSAGRV